MDFAVRIGIPAPTYPVEQPKAPPRDIEAEKAKAAKERRARRRKILMATSIILALVVIGSVYYYIEYAPSPVVSTSSATGTITGIANATVSLGGGSSSPASSSGNARLTIAVGSASFTAFISCWPTKYKVGQTVSVTVNTLQNGRHTYSAPSLSCAGSGGFQFSTTTTTTKSSTSSSSH